MDRRQLADWLRRYVDAWESYDREQIGDLFAEGAEYRYHPYDEPVRGRDVLVESWLEERDDPGTYRGVYEPVALDGDVAVARGTSTYVDDDGNVERIYHNCFVMRFDDSGRCSEFTEWYMKEPRRAD
jgi:nuclear transport factor 2 (NTF2) superfamily protein